jgi:hypothetical protein
MKIRGKYQKTIYVDIRSINIYIHTYIFEESIENKYIYISEECIDKTDAG